MSYSRPHTKQIFNVPFTFEGSVRLRNRAADGTITIFGENRQPGWSHGICVAPVWVDEDNNLMDCVKTNYTKHGTSGQINGVYGIPHSYRYQAEFSHDMLMDGEWHDFRVEVPEVGCHRLFWDDVLAVELIEKNPAPFWSQRKRVELRLDFYDYDIV